MDDVMAAADRLRQVRQAESEVRDLFLATHAVYGPSHQREHSPADDERAIIDTYLAEHPADDGEAVDEAWLRSIGFWHRGDELVSPPHPDRKDRRTPWRLIYYREPRPAYLQTWGLSFPGCEAGLGYNLPTRGDVRRLLAALGATS